MRIRCTRSYISNKKARNNGALLQGSMRDDFPFKILYPWKLSIKCEGRRQDTKGHRKFIRACLLSKLLKDVFQQND